jgi:predicted RNase H-like nuclease (RuvC/YqgF family)
MRVSKETRGKTMRDKLEKAFIGGEEEEMKGQVDSVEVLKERIKELESERQHMLDFFSDYENSCPSLKVALDIAREERKDKNKLKDLLYKANERMHFCLTVLQEP